MSLNIFTDDSSPMSTSDIESFTGKIVCNIDGSSYIIDPENETLSTLNDNSLSVAAISVTNEKPSPSVLQPTKTSTKTYVNFDISAVKDATISHTITALESSSRTLVTSSSFTSSSILRKEGQSQEQDQKELHHKATNPKIHTFRVVSANDVNLHLRQDGNHFKIQNPILMCFICKLSFGITKSFSLHANTEHGLNLQDLEKHLLMQREYSSAIIQRNMDASPQISFLQPVDADTPPMIGSPVSKDFSGVETQLDNDAASSTNTTKQENQTTTAVTVATSATSNISFLSSATSTTSNTSSSSSSSLSSTLSVSTCCTTNNNTILTTSPTKDVVVHVAAASHHDDDHKSQSVYDSTTKSPANTSLAATNTRTTNTTTLSSLNLNKTKTNNYYISNSARAILTTSGTPTTTTFVTSLCTSSSFVAAIEAASTSIATTARSASLSSTSPPPPPPNPTSLSSLLIAGVDLSASGDLVTDAISTDNLVYMHKYNNDNPNNNSIEPQTQGIMNTMHSPNLSPKSRHITTPLPSSSSSQSLNTSIVSEFLQQHLQRLTAVRGETTTDENCQQRNLENYNMSWSQQMANTFSLPTTASNASVTQTSSLHASLAALNSEQNTNSVKLISKFLQHQLVAAQQQQQQHQKQFTSQSLNQAEGYLNPATISTVPNSSSVINMCPEHSDYKGTDCKTCEMLEAHDNYKPSPQITPQISPTNSSIAAAATVGLSLLTAANQLSVSPNHSLNANNFPAALNVSLNTPPLNNPGSVPSFTIGACSDHISGRPLGVECTRCEMILNSARLNNNVQMSTRNSCKTLKCPQCNWHYKYQETLEIHMREKHPDGESACGYCLAGQQHPRLARGESYSCGYKPYRCEICNYSTTTKGNLSIHMQSDKHLNNMQELNSSQNIVAAAVVVATSGVSKLDMVPSINNATAMSGLPSQQQQKHQQQTQLGVSNVSNSVSIAGGNSLPSSCNASSSSLQAGNGNSCVAGNNNSNKHKPLFRCDICSYETSVARNLRIHMTSEKHTHNMAVLQNNIKHIQALTFIQQQQQQQENDFFSDVTVADLAYNQALMIQLLHQNAAATAAQTQTQLPGQNHLSATSPALISATKSGIKLQSSSPPATSEMLTSPLSPKSNELGSSDLTTGSIEPPINPDMWPTTVFSCLICSNFNTNSIDELNQHLMTDRSRQSMPSVCSTRSMSPTAHSSVSISSSNTSSGCTYFSDIMIFQNNNYICLLCNYKTNLKANYQLHSKTDKHLQKLNFINHLREGGASNEYKLKYFQQQQHQIGTNTVQIKCNSCDFYTNSIQKLSLHTQHMRHETMVMIFQHLNYLVKQQKHKQQQQQNQQHDGSSCSNDDGSTNTTRETAPGSLVCTTPVSSAITTTTSSSAQSSSSTATVAAATNPEPSVRHNNSLLCHLCNYEGNSLLEMIQHVKSIRHLQVEHFVCLQRRSEQMETPSLDDVFKLCSKSRRNEHLKEQLSSSPPHTSDVIDDKATCFTNLIATENEDFRHKMFFQENEESKSNTNLRNLRSPASAIHLTYQQQDNSKIKQTLEEKSENITPSNVQTIIYKCKTCDFFGQLKQEVASHIQTVHPNCDISDVISIPTNPVAIQAFQAAMAAATLSAGCQATNSFQTPTPSASPNPAETKLGTTNRDSEDYICPVPIKRERLDLAESEVLPDDPTSVLYEPSTSAEVTNQLKSTGVQCPLCQNYFMEKLALETHLMNVHSVNKDGLARLLLLVDTSIWQSEETRTDSHPKLHIVSEVSSFSAKAINDTTITSTKLPLAGYEISLCQQCGSSFKHELQLLQHAQKMQHYTMQKGEYLCLAFNTCKIHFPSLSAMLNHYNDTHMRLVISERHVYKYRCKQCSLAFKTQEKLATHTLYHTMRDATKCAMCQRSFRSAQALHKHMEQTHGQTIYSENNMECASPRVFSPRACETGRTMTSICETPNESENFENESNRSVTPGPESFHPTQLPSSIQNEQQNSPSPPSPSTQQEQQQQVSTIATLINQHQQNATPSELLHKLQMQHQQFQNLPALNNLQQMQQQFPQFAAAVAASGIPINPFEMLNLMQFHHLISLNFMNLAPPLIFGRNAAASSVTSVNSTTPRNIPNISVSQPPGNIATAIDPTASSSSLNTNMVQTSSISVLPNVDVSTQILQKQQQQISPLVSNTQLLNNQKRARTRITDDQLKILRAHFDINNSPSEESVLEMSQKANLPMKVVKHWFRNTLFKERQRNKDSPYNFNNPPSTTLNLEEYERTGQAKVMPLAEQVQNNQLEIISRPSSAHSISNISEYSNQQQLQTDSKQGEEAETLRSQASSVASSTLPLDVQIKTETSEDLITIPKSTSAESSTTIPMIKFLKQQQQQNVRFCSLDQQEHDLIMMSEQHFSSAAAVQQQQQHAAASSCNTYEAKSESESSDMHSRPHTPNSNTTSNLYASMNDLLSQQLENIPLNQMGPPKKFQINPSSNLCSTICTTPTDRNTQVGVSATSGGSSVIGSTGSSGITISSKLFEKHSPSAQYDNNSNSSNSSTTSSGKRANRTRFTDYQIKVLQEFFENNSYPKDSDLEYLSKLLLLSPRVIVVWFQNARQKQRKIYENQPNNSLYESEEKKQNINYACKKCSLVFQRYYELIRHQKNHCFKEENNKKSAKAQIAAAQIAQNLSSEDSNSSIDINSAAALLAQHHPVIGAAAGLGLNSASGRELSPVPSNGTTPPRDQGNSSNTEHQKFFCDKCKLTFTHFDHLREHQLMHLVNPNLHLPNEGHTTANAAAAVAAYGPFGSILQSLQQAAHQQQTAAANLSTQQPASKKRKYSETSSNADDVSSVGGFSLTGADYDSHAKKYNFLYQYFLQNERNSDLRQQFHNQDSSELNMDYLSNFYQQTELRKRTNYEFLFQYYVNNEQETNANFEVADSKPNIEFLLQYYQLYESKKFFQFEASPQRINDGPLMQCGLSTTQNNLNVSISSNNSSCPASNGSDRSSSPGGSGINEDSNGDGVSDNIENEQHSPLMAAYNNGHKTQSNLQHCNNNKNNNDLLINEELNNHNFCINNSTTERLKGGKLEEQMDQLDGLQEVNNQVNSNHASAITVPESSPTRVMSTMTPVFEINIPPNEASKILGNPLNSKHQTKEAATAENSNPKQANKRLRTTILPEQLNFLYECYQNESNPSRKMLEEIAKKVTLKKRVVQ